MIPEGWGGGGGLRRVTILVPHYHHKNDFCFKMSSGESYFNISFIMRGRGTRQCSQTTTFLKRKER